MPAPYSRRSSDSRITAGERAITTIRSRVGRLRFDPYLLPLFPLGFFLFQPLLAAGIPGAPDALLHLERAALWCWAWDDGVLWPRWQTLAFQGYGYPVLSFQAPLLYLLTSLLSLVLPNILVAFKAVLLLGCLLYPVGMYLWAREPLGRRGALLAAAAYAFAAFRFRELYFLGIYPQFLAFGLYPLILYLFRRPASRPTRLAFAGAGLSLAALIISHNISALLFAPVLAAYCILLAAAFRGERTWRRLAAGCVAAIAVSAIVWLPALAEMRYTRT